MSEPSLAANLLWHETWLSYFGLDTMLKRFLFGGIVSAFVEYLIQPDFAFDNGHIRPWKLLEPDAPDATYLPFFALPIVLGLIFSWFI